MMERGAVDQAGREIVVTNRLALTRAVVEQVCRLFESPTPDVLDRSAGLLETAVGGMAELRLGLRAGSAGYSELEELQRIRRTTVRAGVLLQKAYQYHAGWSAYLGARIGGYGAGGEAAVVIRPSRFLVQG
jgi:hypothetical protein